jgi:hypothetical protein
MGMQEATDFLGVYGCSTKKKNKIGTWEYIDEKFLFTSPSRLSVTIFQ